MYYWVIYYSASNVNNFTEKRFNITHIRNLTTVYSEVKLSYRFNAVGSDSSLMKNRITIKFESVFDVHMGPLKKQISKNLCIFLTVLSCHIAISCPLSLTLIYLCKRRRRHAFCCDCVLCYNRSFKTIICRLKCLALLILS